ncbi:MAG: hypothetical protein ACM31C_01680 [Acidobacteriota bacterium]
MKIFACALIAVVASCGTNDPTSDPNLLPGFKPGPAPANGMQIIMPAIRGLEPGTSEELCSVTNIQVTDKIDVKKLSVVQGTAGHHAALYFTMIPSTEDAHICTDADMVNYRFVGAATTEMDNETPSGIAFEIPAGAYLAVQQHFINAADNAVDTQTAINLYYTDPGAQFTPSHGLAFLNTTLDLKPGVNALDVHCTMQNDVKMWATGPHMHKYGTSFTGTWTHNGVATSISSEATWEAPWEFELPLTTYDTASPLEFFKGDTVDVHCEWNNTSATDLHFGDEMCVLFGMTIDDTGLGSVACDDGSWIAF